MDREDPSQLVSNATHTMQSILDKIRRYERIVKSGKDHNGNALANLRYYVRRLRDIDSSSIHTSL